MWGHCRGQSGVIAGVSVGHCRGQCGVIAGVSVCHSRGQCGVIAGVSVCHSRGHCGGQCKDHCRGQCGVIVEVIAGVSVGSLQVIAGVSVGHCRGHCGVIVEVSVCFRTVGEYVLHCLALVFFAGYWCGAARLQEAIAIWYRGAMSDTSRMAKKL